MTNFATFNFRTLGGLAFTAPAFLAAATLAFLAAPAGAQTELGETGPESQWGELFVHSEFAVPMGHFGDVGNLGWGAGMGGLVYLHQEKRAAIRVEGSLISYGGERGDGVWAYPVATSEDHGDRFPGHDRDVGHGSSSNYLGSVGLGPQIYLRSGPLRPYIFGTVGVSHFSAAGGFSDYDDYGVPEDDDYPGHPWDYDIVEPDFDDWSLALKGGAGLSVLLSSGDRPLSMDVSASYQRMGFSHGFMGADFDEPGIPEGPGRFRQHGPLHGDMRGGWFEPVPSLTSHLTFRVGVSIGMS